MSDLKIRPSTRGIIEDKLLAALEGDGGEDVVAILATRKDLELCIRGLERLMMTTTKNDTLKRIESLRDDYLELKKVGFE